MSTNILNINVGILGHVDSGKTSLAKTLSTVASTASFDKNPQSKERGITLDLGFSSFSTDCPFSNYDRLQFTLVDCPGHASLIRTVIGGAQIIDLMILVVDVQKGMQTQTAECLVLGEITCDKMIVVLNKIDLLGDGKERIVQKMSKKMKLTLQSTKFKDSPIIPVAAKPGGEDSTEESEGITNLIQTLKEFAFVPSRNPSGSFLFSVDHCFSIRGQGTIMTGTILQGTVHINDSVEISSIKESRKVKGIQMFRQPVESASQGDRIGLCVTQFDSKLLERGIVNSPGTVPTLYAVIIDLHKISYFKGRISTKAKFHVSLGHETVLAKVTLFSSSNSNFEFESEYVYQDEVEDNDDDDDEDKYYYGLLEFERPIPVVPNCKVLGSKLDTDVHANTCRLAFQGHIRHVFEDKNYVTKELQLLKVYKNKKKEGIVERLNNDYEVICKNMFKKETDMTAFNGLKVTLSTGEGGYIEGSFGQSGKFKVRLNAPMEEKTKAILSVKKKKGSNVDPLLETVHVQLSFKKYVFDSKKKIIQT